LLAFAEFLQLLLKIEVNTRKTELLLEATAAPKKVVKRTVARKAPVKKNYKKSS
jgi:hypothetical protein